MKNQHSRNERKDQKVARILYENLKSHCASDKHCISGGLAINHLLKLRGFPLLVTHDCDFRFESKTKIEMYARKMISVLEKYTHIVRVNMAHLGLNCDEPEFTTDKYGYRVYFPLCYYNSLPTTSRYEFMWKVFDISHNWYGDPIDIIEEDGLCYLGDSHILKELEINYSEHKE